MAQEKGSGSAGALPSLNVLDTEIIAQKEKECDRKIKELAEVLKSGDRKKSEQCAKEIDTLFEEVMKLKEQCLSYEKDLTDLSDIVLKQKEELDKIGNFVKDVKQLLDKHGEQTALAIGEAYSRLEKQMQDVSRRVDLLRSSVERATQKFGEREYTWLDYAMFGLIFLNVVVTVLVLLIR